VLNKDVEIKEYGQDRDGRTLGVVLLEGKNVNLEMIKAGYAEVYRGTPPQVLIVFPIGKRKRKRERQRRECGLRGTNT
jgi:endonuclease YncB( thermonuclease family)